MCYFYFRKSQRFTFKSLNSRRGYIPKAKSEPAKPARVVKTPSAKPAAKAKAKADPKSKAKAKATPKSAGKTPKDGEDNPPSKRARR